MGGALEGVEWVELGEGGDRDGEGVIFNGVLMRWIDFA